jgi:type III secretion protein V
MSGIPAALQNFLNRNTWVALVATMLVGIAAVVFRPPTWVLDALVVINWASAMAFFGLVFRIESAAALASFPTILQLATTLRILTLFAVLTNIIMTFEAGRLVTRLAPSFDREAMVSTIMTLLLLVLMYKILLAKGSERIASVKARFVLDAMPVKHMGIDGDLRAGVIDMREAQRRREILHQEMQSSPAMEGVAKFVNAEGTLVLIGVALGIVAAITGSQIAEVKPFATLGEATGEAAKLVGGAGLAVILPAIMMSLAAVILITRASSEGSGKDIGTEIGEQVLRRPIVLGMVGFTMLVAGVVMRNLFGALLVLGGAGAIMFAWKMMKAQEVLVQSRILERERLVNRGERPELAA